MSGPRGEVVGREPTKIFLALGYYDIVIIVECIPRSEGGFFPSDSGEANGLEILAEETAWEKAA